MSAAADSPKPRTGVSLAEVYGLLLDDIRRNRAARQQAQADEPRRDAEPQTQRDAEPTEAESSR